MFDSDSLYAIGIVLLCGIPFIALTYFICIKIVNPRRARKEAESKRQLREQGYMGSAPARPDSPVRTAFRFVGVTIMLALTGPLIGLLVALFSNLIYIIFLFPLIIGIIGGSIMADTVRVGKLHKNYQLAFLSLLLAVTIYGGYHYGRYISLYVTTSFQAFQEFSAATEEENLGAAKTLVDYTVKEETGYTGFIGYMLWKAREGVSISRFYRSNRTNLGPILTWFYWALEFVIILLITFSMGRKRMEAAFCEACGNWYVGEKHLGGTAAANEAMVLALIRQKDFASLRKLLEPNAELPSLEVYFLGCETCNQGQSHLIVRRAFQGAKGMLQFKDALQTILQSSENALLLDQVKSIEN